MPGTVRARWRGHYAGLVQGTIPISDGDMYLIYPAEAWGQTSLYHRDTGQMELIGYGHVAKAEHAGLSKAALEELGYRFDEPSPNWEPLDPFVPGTFAQTSLPAEIDLSEYLVETPQEAAVQAEPALEASKDDEGHIEIVTRLPPPAEPPAESATPSVESDS